MTVSGAVSTAAAAVRKNHQPCRTFRQRKVSLQVNAAQRDADGCAIHLRTCRSHTFTVCIRTASASSRLPSLQARFFQTRQVCLHLVELHPRHFKQAAIDARYFCPGFVVVQKAPNRGSSATDADGLSQTLFLFDKTRVLHGGVRCTHKAESGNARQWRARIVKKVICAILRANGGYAPSVAGERDGNAKHSLFVAVAFHLPLS